MQSPKPIWSEQENHRFHLRPESLSVSVIGAPMRSLTPIWPDHRNSRFLMPVPDPEIILHATVREFDDHYLMVSDRDWTAPSLD